MGFHQFDRSDPSTNERYKGRHRREHWYRDNTIYFITAKCISGEPLFRHDDAKLIFRDRFAHYTLQAGFVPWVWTLLDNHYHLLGYLGTGELLREMMRKLHGSVAKLVNDTLGVRRVPFWEDDYFDGCLRNDLQLKRTWYYVRDQAVKAGLVRHHGEYAWTHVAWQLDMCQKFAKAWDCYLPSVPYARYERKHQSDESGSAT
jgi:hypothetical protein